MERVIIWRLQEARAWEVGTLLERIPLAQYWGEIRPQCQMVSTEIRLIIFFVAKDGEALNSQKKTTSGADYGSEHEFNIAKFRLKLKKVGKTTRPFRYDLNQIPYHYTMEVRNRFKGLDLIDRAPDELWTEVRDIVRRQGSRPFPWKRNAKK